jgi:hypothetical protein
MMPYDEKEICAEEYKFFDDDYPNYCIRQWIKREFDLFENE